MSKVRHCDVPENHSNKCAVCDGLKFHTFAPMKEIKGGIISIGDELLIGQTINTNAGWMGEILTQY